MKIVTYKNTIVLAHKTAFESEKEAKTYMLLALEPNIELAIMKDLSAFHRSSEHAPVEKLEQSQVMISGKSGIGAMTIEKFLKNRNVFKI